MWRPEPRAGCGSSPGSPGCPDLLQHAPALRPQDSPLYLSFFEEECRLIADRLLLGAAAEPARGPCEGSAPCPDPAGPFTSTPLPGPPAGSGSSEAAAAPAPAPAPARGQPGLPAQPAAGAAPPARPPGRARRGAANPPGPRSPGRGRARAPQGPPLPPQPAGARLKVVPPARPRAQHPGGPQHSALPKPAPRERLPKTAVKVGSHKQPSSRLSTAVPTVASRSSLRPLGTVPSSKHFYFCKGSTTQERVCNRTQELKENGESKGQLIAVGTALGAGRANQTWERVESSFSSNLAPGLPSGCEDAVPAEQSAGYQLSWELECVKKELERVKGELADKTAQCEAYQQTISSLLAQLRAAGDCLEDAAVFKSGDLGRD